MVLSIIIILFIGVIAFFHFVQGFFSATISAMITIIAAVTAVSYHENVVNLLLKGKMADVAHSMVLCIVFAVVYIVLRLIFDAAIPGNVRTPSTVDKVGAAIMGIVSGIFATGIFAIAVQMLPFDPNIGFMGAPRYATRDNLQVILPTHGSSLDTKIYEQMDDNALTPDKEKGLLLPVDDWVLDTVYHLSDGGSLSGDRSLASVHPDYLQELFGERIGIQTGGRRVALYNSANQTIDIKGVYSAASLPAKDGELKETRPTAYSPIIKLDKDGNGVVKPTGDQRILIVRVKINSGATDDDDHIFRFSCGSIRIVGKTQNNGYKDFYPIGTLEGRTVLLNNPDDFLFVQEGKAFDAVFLVDDSLLTPSGKSTNKVADGTFITIKRFANLDLSGQDVGERIPGDADLQMIRQPVLVERLKLPPAPPAGATADNTPVPVTPTPTPVNPTPSTPTPPAETAPQKEPGKEIAHSITASIDTSIEAPGFIGIGVPSADQPATDLAVAGGTVSFVKSGAISAAKIDPTVMLAKLGEGTGLSQLSCPADSAMVQVVVKPYTLGWNWIGEIKPAAQGIHLVDTNGNPYTPNGCYQLAKVGDGHGLFLRYDAQRTLSANSPDAPADGDIYLIFLIPKTTDINIFAVGNRQQNLDSLLHVP